MWYVYYLHVTMHCSRPLVINSWQWILYPRRSRAFFMTDDHEFNTQCMAISVAQGSYMYVYGFTRISVLACFYHLHSVLFTSVWFLIWSAFCLSQLFAASSSKLNVLTSTCLRNTPLCKAAGVFCCGDFSAVHIDVLLDSTLHPYCRCDQSSKGFFRWAAFTCCAGNPTEGPRCWVSCLSSWRQHRTWKLRSTSAFAGHTCRLSTFQYHIRRCLHCRRCKTVILLAWDSLRHTCA